MTVVGSDELIAQAGLADAGFTHHPHHLPTPLLDLHQTGPVGRPIPAHAPRIGSADAAHASRSGVSLWPEADHRIARSSGSPVTALTRLQLTPGLDQPPDLRRDQDFPRPAWPSSRTGQRQRLPYRQQPGRGVLASAIHQHLAPVHGLPQLPDSAPSREPRVLRPAAAAPAPPAPRAVATAPACEAPQSRRGAATASAGGSPRRSPCTFSTMVCSQRRGHCPGFIARGLTLDGRPARSAQSPAPPPASAPSAGASAAALRFGRLSMPDDQRCGHTLHPGPFPSNCEGSVRGDGLP